jgi:flagellar biogenesis protein FliO
MTKNSDEQEHGSAFRNIVKIIFLIAVLVAAWFVLERLMGSK